MPRVGLAALLLNLRCDPEETKDSFVWKLRQARHGCCDEATPELGFPLVVPKLT
jgi:hypothetical protein